MINVVFVGDEPSKTNIDPTIPFVGAKCFSTFVSWIKILELDYYVTYNSSFRDLLMIEKLAEAGFKVVAFGSKASRRLNKLGIIHYRLNHPSGLNRKNNDIEYVTDELLMCKDYINS